MNSNELPKLDSLTLDEFRKFVGFGAFTIVFYKLPKTADEREQGRGELRRMNAMMGVKRHVKGTQPETTAKRRATNESKNQTACFEMADVNEGGMKLEYRTLTVDASRIVSLTANKVTLYNPLLVRETLSHPAIADILFDVDLGKDALIEKHVDALS